MATPGAAARKRLVNHYLNAKAGKVIRAARTHSSRKPRLPEAVQNEHAEIFAALSAGDPGRARAATLKHLRNAARRLGLKLNEPDRL